MTQSPTEINETRSPVRPGGLTVISVSLLVVLFRVMAWRSPSSFIVIPPSLVLPLGALGILFLVCGARVFRSRPSGLTRIFFAYGVGGAIHWGGSIDAGRDGASLALLTLYVAVTAMGDAAFLHLALRYARSWRFPVRILYLPAIVALLAVPVLPFLPRGSVDQVLGLLIGVAFATSMAGGVVFLLKWFRLYGPERRKYFLTPIAAALIVASALDFLGEGGLLPGDPALWTLPYAIVPLTLAWALVRSPK